ncbi:MAG: glycosyltransferase [Lachnospiraceae bacterium]|nr:glycosyltransferase [Lachnospiraceae bacterium]
MEVGRILKDDGIFIISSPNKAIYSDLFDYNNEFHVHEMYKDEFKELLMKSFPYVTMYNQYLEVASIIDNNELISSQALYKKNIDSYTSDGKYFIAIASKNPTADITIQSVYLKHKVTYRDNIKRIYNLQKEVDDRNHHLSVLNGDIKDRDNRIVELQEEHEKDVEQLKKCWDEIEQYKKIEEQLNCVQKQLSETQQRNTELSEKIQANEYELKQANRLIHDKDVHIRNLEASIKLKDDYINKVEPYAKVFRKIKHSPVAKAAKVPVRAARKIKQSVAENKTIHKLVVPEFSKPKVSIIIPVYNQFDYTYECVKSIIKNTKKVKYEIIIGDDVSTDKTVDISKYIKGINVIRNKENLKFLLNCNNAAKYARGKYILFLNNDTKVTDGWLSSLVELIESDSTIGMVGSKLIYPDGRLQEAGGIIWKDASAWNYGNGQDPEKPEFNYVRDVDYISGAAIMLSKKLWNKIGGFDEDFAPAYCEDSDLAFQVREQGYRVVYQPASVVVHFEGVSNGTDTSTGLKHYQIVNNDKLKTKWAHRLKDHYPNGECVLKAKDRCFGDKKTILFIDHYVPQFDKDAGSRTVYQYVKMFVKKGYAVKFIGDNFFKHEPYTTVLNKMGVEVLHGPWYAEHIFEWLEDNKDCIDYVFMNRPHISEKYIDFFKEHMNAKIIYYGHDLHFLRINREYELTGEEDKKQEALSWKTKEMELMHKADVVYYPSYIEADLIKEIDANINVKALVPYVYDEFKEANRDSSKNKGILFVGGFSHTPNVDAVNWFVKEVYDKIRDKKDIPFYIAGSNPPDEILAYNGNGIDVKGFVSDEELEALYNNCKLVVVPLRYGAGVKGKVVEAIYNGVPIITTSVGAEGIPDTDKILVVKDEPTDFAKAVLELYDDNNRLDKISANMQKYIKENNSIDAAWDVVGADFS